MNTVIESTRWVIFSVFMSALLVACGGGGSGSDSINAVRSVNVTVPNASSIASGDTRQLSASVTFDDGGTADVSAQVEYSTPQDGGPANARIIGIDDNGLLTALRAGSTTLTALFDGKSQTITVNVAVARLESIAIAAQGLMTQNGQRRVFENATGVSFTARGTFSDGSTRVLPNAQFSSNNTGALSFASATSGNATIGSVTVDSPVTVTAAQDGKSRTFNLTVLNDAITSISIRMLDDDGGAVVPAQTNRQLSAFANTTSGREINITTTALWAIPQSNVATVGNGAQGGLVRGLAEGNATLTASQDSVTSPTIAVTVTADITALRVELVSPDQPSVTAGVDGQDTATLRAIATFSDNSERAVSAQWSTTDTTFISVPNPNVGEAVGQRRTAAGDPATVTASISQGGNSFTANIDITVTAVLQSITVSPATASVIAGVTGSDQQQFQAFGTFSDSNSADTTPLPGVTWSLNPTDTDKASITTSGLATGLKRTGDTPVTVVASKGDATPGNAALTVTAALVSISITPDSDPVNSPAGIAQLFKAFGTFSDGAPEERLSDVTWALENITPAGQVSSTTVTTADTSSGAEVGDVQVTGTQQGASADVVASRDGINSDDNNPPVMFVTTAAIVTAIDVVPPGTNPADPFEIPVNGDDQFRAVASFSDGRNGVDVTNNVQWASFDPATNSSTASTAAVGNTPMGNGNNGNKGLVLGIAASPPVANIMATFSNPANSSPATVSGNYQVRVIEAEPFFIEISRAPDGAAEDVAIGFDLQFIATGFFAGATEPRDITDEVTWSVNVAPSIATIDNTDGSNGLLTAQGTSDAATFSESVIVIATLNTSDGSVSNTSSAEVRDATITSISVESSRGITQLPIGETEQYRAIGTFTPALASGDTSTFTMDLSQQVTWSAPAANTPNGNADAASVGNVGDGTAGLVRGEAAGDAAITADCGAPGDTAGTRCNNNFGQQVSGSSNLTVTDAVVVALCIYLPENEPCSNGPLGAGETATPVSVSLSLGRSRQVAVAAEFSDGSVENNYQTSANLEFRFEDCSITGGDATDCDVASEVDGNFSADAVGTASIRAVATAAGTDSMSEVNSRETLGLTVTAAVLEQLCIEPVGLDPDSNCAANGYTSVNRNLPNGLSSTSYRARLRFSDGTTEIITINSSPLDYVSGTPGIFTVGRNNGSISFADPVTADSVGEVVTITATYTDSNNSDLKTTASADVTITAAELQSVAITDPLAPDTGVIQIAFSGATQITATATFTDGTTQNVTSQSNWSSADSNVVFVNSQGVANRTNGGSGDTANIMVSYTFNGTPATNTKSAEIQPPRINGYRVRVQGGGASTVAVGNMITFEAFAVRQDGSEDAAAATNVEWSIVQVDGDATIDAATGVATGVAAGQVRVVASGPRNSGQATLTVTQ